MTTPYRMATAAVTGLALLGVAGCGSSNAQPSEPAQVVVLSSGLNAAALRHLPVTTVRLKAGESFAVQHLVGSQSRSWVQTDRGSGTVLGSGKAFTASPCPAGQTGCSPRMDTVYVAKAPGTTTVVWTFVPMGGCTHGTPACERFPKTIRVIVH